MLTSKSNSDYVPNLSTLAQQKYDLVIGVGFLMADAMNTVATKFPDTKFAIIDVDATTPQGQADERRPACSSRSRRRATSSATWPACTPRTTTATRSARSAARRSRRSTTTSPATRPAPRPPNPDIKTLNGYSQDFVDQAKCKEIALNQIAKGSKVVFQVAGQCGLGALDAAKEKGVQGIGVDADQAYLGDHIMTSAEKKVDVAVVRPRSRRPRTARSRAARTPPSTSRTTASAIGKTERRGRQVRRPRSRRSPDKIKSGEITDIPDTVK